MTYLGDGETDAVTARGGAAPSMTLGTTTATTVASTSLTGGRYSMYRLRLGPNGGGASPHFHRTFAESFHVLSGTVELFDGSEWIETSVDDHLFVPEGSVHGFRNVAPEPAELLMMSAPGVRREDYFAELMEIATSGRQLSAEEMTAMFARHDQFMV